MVRNKNTLVFDSNALCYRSLYTMGDLSNNNIATGIIFGFLNQVFKYCKLYKTTDAVFCWDSKESLRRLLYFADYKSGRAKKRKEASKEEKKNMAIAFNQFDKLREEVIYDLGFRNIFHKRGYESDDLVAMVPRSIAGNFIIFSNDGDLLQLIDDNVSYYNLGKNKVLDKKGFIKEYKIQSELYAEVKAITGCSTDEVPGIRGIGEKKAIAYILGKGTEKDKEKINASMDIIIRNRKLVTLPLENIKLKFSPNKFTANKFIDVFHKYNFKSFLEAKYFDKLKELFCNGV
uniref:Putative exonuclease n=1 Tax=viral metagenome TaxID=1070528 RepID=A0A6M3LJI7_9ZZZZ